MKNILAILSISLFTILLVNLYNSQNIDNNINNSNNLSAYDSIIEKGTIEVGYIPYNKSFIVDSNSGEYSGIFYEVMEEVGKRLNLEVSYKYELGWGDMITALKNDKIDLMVTGIWPTASRSKHVEYIQPLYYSPVYAYTNHNREDFDNQLEKINNPEIKIGVIDGEITNVIRNNDFPLSTKYPSSQLTNIDQLMLDIISKKTDVTFLEASVAQSFMKNNPGKIQKIISDKPLRKFGNSMLVKKGEFKLKTMIDNTIMELENEGFIKNIINKYDNNQGNFIQ